MIIMKFGGTSVGNTKMIVKLTEIVKKKLPENPIVVVSAFSGITNLLIELAESAVKKKLTDNTFNKIINKHYEIITDLGIDKEVISKEVKQLNDLIMGISILQELTPRIMDNLLSFGERMSARIIAAYMLNIGLQAKAYDAFDIGMITTSEFGNADILEDSYTAIKNHLSDLNHLPIITGFIGKDKEGRITTLGRGGSDYTATIIGAAMHAKAIEIWTDVDGIMTADPHIVKNAKSIDTLSSDEASELAFLGAKVLHPKTILPAMKMKIPVHVLNTFNPSHVGTIVSDKLPKNNGRIVSITYKKGISVINISTPRMFEVHGFLKKIFEIFDRNDISVDMVSTSEINVSVTIDGDQKTSKLETELSKISDIYIKKDRTIVSLVGHNISYVPRILSMMFSALGDIPIEMISSSMSEINQSFVVKDEHAEEAIRRLHAVFFGD